MRWIAVPLFTLAAAFAPLALAADTAKDIPSPIEKPLAVLDALRANDAEALAEAASGDPSDVIAREWEEKRAKAASDDDSPTRDADAHRVWAMLQTKEGTAALVDELHPKITEKAGTAVLQFNLGLAAMLTAISSQAELSLEESQQLSQLALAAQRWANGIDWSDRTRLAKALDAVSAFVRGSGLASPKELELLAYEDALAIGDDAIAMGKRIAAAYDLDVDATLGSISIEELARDGETAKVRTSLTLLGVPLSITRDLVYRDGRWIESRHADVLDAPGTADAKPATTIR
jgi:hypothetical protein